MDDPPVALKLFELVLIFGGVLAFCFWELYKLRRDRRREREREARDGEAEP